MGCDNAVFHLLSEIAKAQRNGFSYFCVIFLDLLKAFDRVSHLTIVSALYDYGVPEFLIRTIASWLTGRTAVVSNRGVISEEMDVVSGVPQGSKLGPLLFLYAFSHAIARCGFSAGDLDLFADDSNVMGAVNTVPDVLEIQLKLNRFCLARSRVDLAINASKCACMIFRTGVKPRPDIAINFTIAGTPVAVVPHFEFLGVQIDGELEFSHHCAEVAKRCRTSIYFIRRMVKERTIDKPRCFLRQRFWESFSTVWHL